MREIDDMEWEDWTKIEKNLIAFFHFWTLSLTILTPFSQDEDQWNDEEEKCWDRLSEIIAANKLRAASLPHWHSLIWCCDLWLKIQRNAELSI